MYQATPTAALPPALTEAIRLRQAGDAAGALALAEGHAAATEAGAPVLAIAGLAALELGDAPRAVQILAQVAEALHELLVVGAPLDEQVSDAVGDRQIAVGLHYQLVLAMMVTDKSNIWLVVAVYIISFSD